MSIVVAFEGIDGAGKSTLSHLFVEELRRQNRMVQFIDKKSNRPLRMIYKELLTSNKFISNELSLLLGFADYKYVQDYLEDYEQEIIVYDRCFISSIVDLLSLRILNLEKVDDIIKLFKVPDIIYFVDRNAQEVLSSKQIISKAEAGGELYKDLNIVDGFIKFQSTNYYWYKKILSQYFADTNFSVKNKKVEDSCYQILEHFTQNILT